jgi:hypothetical protein
MVLWSGKIHQNYGWAVARAMKIRATVRAKEKNKTTNINPPRQFLFGVGDGLNRRVRHLKRKAVAQSISHIEKHAFNMPAASRKY